MVPSDKILTDGLETKIKVKVEIRAVKMMGPLIGNILMGVQNIL